MYESFNNAKQGLRKKKKKTLKGEICIPHLRFFLLYFKNKQTKKQQTNKIPWEASWVWIICVHLGKCPLKDYFDGSFFFFFV